MSELPCSISIQTWKLSERSESNKRIVLAEDCIGKCAARSTAQAKTTIRQVVENMIKTNEIRLPVN